MKSQALGASVSTSYLAAAFAFAVESCAPPQVVRVHARTHSILASKSPPTLVSATPPTDSHVTEHAPSLSALLCEGKCEISEVTRISGKLSLVKTAWSSLERGKDEGPNYPVYFAVQFDSAGGVVVQQRLATAFLEEPTGEVLASTFSLTQLPDGDFFLSVHEPSPTGNAWGCDGSVRFRWPELELVEWEYSYWHSAGLPMSATETWSWLTVTGRKTDVGASFAFAVPKMKLESTFKTEGWKTAEVTGCAPVLDSRNGTFRASGSGESLSLRAIVSDENELFLFLEETHENPKITVCYSGEFLRGDPDSKTPPACTQVSKANAKVGDAAPVESNDTQSRYKVPLPDWVSDFTIIVEKKSGARLMSSPFDFKRERTLGPPLGMKYASCTFDRGKLVPHFDRPRPDYDLMDSLKNE